MMPSPFNGLPETCEAFQRQLSDCADSGSAPTPELLTHLDSCAECARFGERWLAGPPVELARSAAGLPDTRLRGQILDAAAAPRVVRFVPPGTASQPWSTWLGRIAACLALAGFSYWLLRPVPSPVGKRPTAVTAPTLSQGLAQMEARTQHEQQILQTALVDGGRQVHGNVVWSVSALEL